MDSLDSWLLIHGHREHTLRPSSDTRLGRLDHVMHITVAPRQILQNFENLFAPLFPAR
jgi:hypothetical protein